MTKGTVRLKVEKNASNVIEAAATGAGDGMQLALNVGAMLLAFIAGIALINYLFVGLGDLLHVNAYLTAHFGMPLSLQLIFGVVLRYLAIGIGVPVRRRLPLRQPAGHQGGAERIRRPTSTWSA